MNLRTLNPFLHHRDSTQRKTGFMLHATAGRENPANSVTNAIDTLRANNFGYHYIIAKDGTVYKCCPASAIVSHAGLSESWDGPNCNDYTIGICFVNADGCEAVNGVWKFTGRIDPVTPLQIAAALELIAELKRQFPSANQITTHAYAATPKGRKIDPYGFDIMEFAQRANLKLWRPTWSVDGHHNK